MKVTLDATKVSAAYSDAFKRLRGMNGFSQKAILRAEMGSILKAWAGDTKVATADQIERRTRARVAYNLGMQKASDNVARVTVNNGARGGFRGEMWHRTLKNKKWQQAGRVLANDNFVPANIHWRTFEWNQIQQAGADYVKQLRIRRAASQKASGLARQSVVQIADQLGIDLNDVAGGGVSAAGIAKARAALASSGKFNQNGVGSQGGDETKGYVEGFTRLPYGSKIGMDRSLLGVLARRASFIQQAYKKGAFESIAREAKAFPNIFRVGELMSQ